MGQFWAVLVRMEDRRECSDRKIVSQCREPARRVYYRAVVEVKKEIPVSATHAVPDSLGRHDEGKTFVNA